MSETQHHNFDQEQAHFIQSGTRSAKVYLDDFPDVINSTNREHAKAHAFWPFLRCVALAVALWSLWSLWWWGGGRREEEEEEVEVVVCGVWCGVVWCGVVWCGVVWCGVVWCAVC